VLLSPAEGVDDPSIRYSPGGRPMCEPPDEGHSVTFDEIGDPRYIALRTFRKTGVGVSTAVWAVRDDGRLLVRTDTGSGKAKRIRNNSTADICVSDMRGRPKGPWVEARARLSDAPEDEIRIMSGLKRKYGLQFRLISLFSRDAVGFGDIVIEIAPRA
jgi:uncharacterized protein